MEGEGEEGDGRGRRGKGMEGGEEGERKNSSAIIVVNISCTVRNEGNHLTVQVVVNTN